MSNLIRMDLYRMRKARSFKVCLVLAFLSGFIQMPVVKLVSMLLKLIPGSTDVTSLVPKNATMSSIISNPFPVLNLMLIMFSAVYFFYADLEHGYIKNIAGQMPKKGYTVLSRYIALICHNLVFTIAGIFGNLIGSLLIVKVVMDKDIPKSLGDVVLRLVLLQAVCAILLLVTVSLRSKNFGMVLAVVMAFNMMDLIYMSINTGLGMALKKTFKIEKYMPDHLLGLESPKPAYALPAAAITIAVFLFLAIRITDRRDVK